MPLAEGSPALQEENSAVNHHRAIQLSFYLGR